MQYRQVTTAAGYCFAVPEHIIRIDDEAFSGWQLRYGEWTDYPDCPEGRGGAEKALRQAMFEMQFRIDTLGK
jgi:hypothetical protein